MTRQVVGRAAPFQCAQRPQGGAYPIGGKGFLGGVKCIMRRCAPTGFKIGQRKGLIAGCVIRKNDGLNVLRNKMVDERQRVEFVLTKIVKGPAQVGC